MQDVLQDLFNHEAPAAAAPSSPSSPSSAPHQDGVSAAVCYEFSRTAPLQGLLTRLALHALLFGNARAVAWLWQRFVRELRFGCWDAERPLPRMTPPGSSSGSG
ncbi:hypothetical protein Agub_g2627, partial [Astrephomene gubernaculifera]